jgi:hypothetical protein
MSTAARPPRHAQGSYLTPAFERGTVADAMHAGIVTYPPDAPLETVARTITSCSSAACATSSSRGAMPGRSAWLTLDVGGVMARDRG